MMTIFESSDDSCRCSFNLSDSFLTSPKNNQSGKTNDSSNIEISHSQSTKQYGIPLFRNESIFNIIANTGKTAKTAKGVKNVKRGPARVLKVHKDLLEKVRKQEKEKLMIKRMEIYNFKVKISEGSLISSPYTKTNRYSYSRNSYINSFYGESSQTLKAKLCNIKQRISNAKDVLNELAYTSDKSIFYSNSKIGCNKSIHNRQRIARL